MKAVITLEGQDLPIYEKGQEAEINQYGRSIYGIVEESTRGRLMLHVNIHGVFQRRQPQPIQMINFSQPVDNGGGFGRGLAIGYEEGRNSKR